MAKTSPRRHGGTEKTIPPGYHAAVSIDAIKPHPRNPRRGDLPAIAESILANGWYGCVVVQASTGFIVAGNHARRSAGDLGATTVPVLSLDLTDSQAIAILLADNKLGDKASYDKKHLAEVLKQIRDEAKTLAGTTFTDAELDKLIKEQLDAPVSAGSQNPAPDEDPKLVYRLVIQCKDEADQTKLLRSLTKRGLDPRASVA